MEKPKRAPLWMYLLSWGVIFTFVPYFVLGFMRLKPAVPNTTPLTLFALGAAVGWMLWKRSTK